MNRKGFSLLEIVVGLALLGIVALGFFTFQSQTLKMVQVVSDNAALAQGLTAIERDIANDVPFLPPQDNDDAARASALFVDAQRAQERCYEKTGARVNSCANFATDATVFFSVRFYKAAVVDAAMDATSPMAQIPLSRVRMQVTYKVSGKVQEPMYFTRLFADALRF